ncbi:interleukin-6 receptor subunit beta [Polymixia lowei]
MLQASPVQSTDGNRCIVGNLNSSLAYEVQIQCVSSTKCPQCPWSEIYIVPPELTVQPVIVKVQDTDITEREGCRLLSLTWKFPARELVEGYNVNIQKASGEAPCVRMNTSRPEIRLILSSSAYLLSITAFNKASTSPAAVWTILPRGDMEPVEPYKRYNITLHVRPNKDTCNIKHVNNSECTYGSKQFYFIEGSPIGAPTNISSYNVTLNSMVLEWLPVPEEAVRGFLLGYTIHYNEYHQRGTYTETNITVDPVSNSYELGNLKSGTMYLVQISAFTHAGAGVRSATSYFETPSQGHLSVSTLTAFVVVTTVIICIILFGSLLLKRAKICFWPSIPNPGNSSAIQKIDGPYELELREPINTQKLEEWDTDSLQIIELSPTVTSYLTHDTEVERNSHSELSPDAPCVDQYQRDTGSTSGELSSGATADASSNMQQKDSQSSPFNFTSGYTTMELFQQAVPQSVAASITTVSQAAAHKPEETDSTVIRSELDYVRQFSTSPVNSSEECSTFI